MVTTRRTASNTNARRDPLVSALRRALGADQVKDDVAARLVYSRDASHLQLGRPACVVIARHASAVARTVALCRQHGRPFVVRGGGTGLAGGALPPDDAVVLALGRLDSLGEVDDVRRRVQVGAGVVNDAVSAWATRYGLRFAPDPSSQAAATIGGNVAVNAGGPHCLKDGVTSRHVRCLEWVDTWGRRWSTGHCSALTRGLDLRGLLVGSEGTLGVVTSAVVDLQPVPRSSLVLLAEFPRLADATRAVVKLMGSGVVPQACEIVDRVMLGAVEEAFQQGFATDVDAVMICELAGIPEAVGEDARVAEAVLMQSGVRRVQRAIEPEEQARLWNCRKQAFGAVGRLAPACVSMDVVVPLARLTDLVEGIQTITDEHGVKVATAFHAGDGNLHPGVQFDDRDPDQTVRANRAADAIIERAQTLGGSCTGEHGVGLEKRHLVHRQLDPVALDLMRGIKDLMDPENLCNPDKALPARELVGRGHKPVPEGIEFDWDSLTVTAPASTPLAELQAAALERGLWVPVGVAAGDGHGPGLAGEMTVGQLLSTGTAGPSLLGELRVRDSVLEIWARTGRGDVLHAGAPVLKNVAGYDLVRLLVGSGDLLARPLAASFALQPAPAAVSMWVWPSTPVALSVEGRQDIMQVLRLHHAPAMVARERSQDSPSLWVAASGRDSAWDLGAMAGLLETWSEDHGMPRPVEVRLPRAALADGRLTALLPAWCRTSPSWTLLTPAEGRPEWPRPPRLVWHTRPTVLWTPDELRDDPVGWRSDPVIRDNVPQPPPSPPPESPAWLLAGLRRLFDPSSTLPCPSWLEQILGEASP